jgi:hypothetical protein
MKLAAGAVELQMQAIQRSLDVLLAGALLLALAMWEGHEPIDGLWDKSAPG